MNRSTAVKRSYDARRRLAGAERTRQAILAAAATLFVEPGYAATRLRDLADHAEVAVPTITAHFGTKSGVLSALVDVAIAGDDHPVALADRPFVAEIAAEAGLRNKLARYAVHLAAVQARLVDVHLAVQSAATADPEAAALWQRMGEQRRAGMGLLAAELMTTGEVRAGLGADEVADMLWLAMDAGSYDWLVRRRGWSEAAYRDWYVRSVAGAITGPATRTEAADSP